MMQTPHYLHKDSQLPEQLSFIRWRSGTQRTSASLAWAETSLNNDMFFSHILTLPSVLPWCFYTTGFQHYRQGARLGYFTNLTEMHVGVRCSSIHPQGSGFVVKLGSRNSLLYAARPNSQTLQRRVAFWFWGGAVRARRSPRPPCQIKEVIISTMMPTRSRHRARREETEQLISVGQPEP